jgi:hypothetical protein
VIFIRDHGTPPQYQDYRNGIAQFAQILQVGSGKDRFWVIFQAIAGVQMPKKGVKLRLGA